MTIGPSHPLSGSKRKRTNTSNIQGAGKKATQLPTTPETKKQNTRTSSKSRVGGTASSHSMTYGFTPSKHSSQSAGALSNTSRDLSEIQVERKGQAEADVAERLREARDTVHDVVKPENPVNNSLSDELVTFTAELLERYIRGDAMPQDVCTREDKEFHDTLMNLAVSFMAWLSESSPPPRESLMYKPKNALVWFVAHCVKHKLPARPLTTSRLVLPVENPDRKAGDSDDRTRPDMMLITRLIDSDLDKVPKRPSYSDALAIIEAKRSERHELEAQRQLFYQTRQLYFNQPNRRFAWGLTLCNKIACAYLFTNDDVFRTPDMDLGSPSGRHSFVQLLVRFSLCETHQLGYDSNFVELGSGKWKIICHDGDDCKEYYVTDIPVRAERLFGRHTRCFIASPTDPWTSDSNEENVERVAIKDAWSRATESEKDDVRDEVAMMRKFDSELRGMKESDDLIYPEVMIGGRVTYVNGEGIVTSDNTKHILKAPLSESFSDICFRAHKVIVMAPVGRDLSGLESANELIQVAADVMQFHSALVKHCNILHRDISDNNILLVEKDGRQRGMLIDFDYALDISIEGQTAHKDRTGTLPFMSVNNLLASDAPRTALDDWESMLYLLCWIGTFWVNDKYKRADEFQDALQINRWRTGSTEAITEAKRDNLHTKDNFAKNIAKKLHPDVPGCKYLRALVEHLRAALIVSDINNPNICGAYTMDPPEPEDGDFESYLDQKDIDPFFERARDKDVVESISACLLKILGDAAQKTSTN